MATPSLQTVMAEERQVASYRVLGVRVDAVQIGDAVKRMEKWIERREGGKYIAVTGMHGVMEAMHEEEFGRILKGASLVVPDGYPLVVLGRRKGFALARRVYGPELMEVFCEETAGRGYRHYFYGGAEGVAEELARRFTGRFAGMEVAGTYCPPFRELTEAEEREVCEKINAARADVVWVGLSTPKQERWMARHREMLNVPVMVGVGAAFDFHTGRVAQAPRWMRENGMEWFFRLMSEPRRLWRRYLVNGSEFAWLVMLEQLGLRKF
ncbi:MAG TPA: WecB/TagA/CpsF family glycosyltransferase [Candidatus Acidoferrum sp.]|jgi:N-acetylglucosaminyldiphosphoundecaprenol N-acetyl-beta-D-mannosaminyltransferase|nr:WecB/TagA/CpsF family glycosyltransferase [Candidatus Acidoferrum sp.]